MVLGSSNDPKRKPQDRTGNWIQGFHDINDVKTFLAAQFSYLQWPIPYVGNTEAISLIGENFRVIHYKMIVRHCYEAEHLPEHCVHGGYQAEKVRRIMKKLKRDGLICYEPDTATASSNHFDFLGFTERGRELFTENGQIKAVYKV